MIEWIIKKSMEYRACVLVIFIGITISGLWAVRNIPVDALPDLSDVQVIIRTTFPGQAPELVENQVTYPLTTTMLSVPGVKTVRGYSFFGDSFVYVLFDDHTDLYWARSRVLEYLNQAQSRLPQNAKSVLGPDATGVGWIFQYALVDRSGKQDLGNLRAIQDWFLKFELKTLPNVAEVASVGGMVKQYQVVIDPEKLTQFRLSHAQVVEAIRQANESVGGAVVELTDAEYMVRAKGYLTDAVTFKNIPILTASSGITITLQQVARITLGPEMRRAVTDLDGEGEAVGGIVLLRSGKNALETIEAVKTKLTELQHSLPAGVEVVITYDRSTLIKEAIKHLSSKIIEEFIVVSLVCLLFLWHVRSAMVAVISLPVGILMAFIIMRFQGINADIMSLGGIAIAIGAMIDAAIVMIENAHKKLEQWQQNQHTIPDITTRWRIITDATLEVAPALFMSLLIITLSFLPIFSLQAQEGRLFTPLALTKTYAMASAAILSITLMPVLMGYWIKGRIPSEANNPLNHFFMKLYRPMLQKALRRPKSVLVISLLLLMSTLWPLHKIGSEFMPPLDEGDILYMPSALPGLSIAKARALLQHTNQMIKQVPEVSRVFGKAGRAETATDPAPVEMLETVIQLKPRHQWRAGMTTEKIIEALDKTVVVPELTNVWVPPIRNRIDMLSTGIKSPIGIKVSGVDVVQLDNISQQIASLIKPVSGVTSVFAERLSGGRYIDIDVDRVAAGRMGLNMSEVQSVVASVLGGENIGEVIENTARFPINVRYPRDWRDSVEAIQQLPMVTSAGAALRLGDIAKVSTQEGVTMLRSENARLTNLIYIDVRGRDLRAVVNDVQAVIAQHVVLPVGASVSFSGQFEFLERAQKRLEWIVPVTLIIIGLLLFFVFKRWADVITIIATLPFALIGGVWLLYGMAYHFSVAVAVGFIALAGLAAEFGVVMLLYLRMALDKQRQSNNLPLTEALLIQAIEEGAILRIRPKTMTVAVILAGLLPVLLGEGAGADVMSRIAAPMVGGMITAPLLSLFVIPVVFLLWERKNTPS